MSEKAFPITTSTLVCIGDTVFLYKDVAVVSCLSACCEMCFKNHITASFDERMISENTSWDIT